ncbi:MAG: helix-turn-helix domain-containing protein [Anaerolineae bacterium]|nr:helix-turn-helix domain-containing protein [Anaerolineae bacterium]
MDTTYSFGYWVKRRRKALDLTQQAVADCVGCATVTIKKIEADARRPSPITAARLAHCLAIAADERERFLAMASGEQPSDSLTLTHTPISTLTDYIPQPVNPFLGRETESATLLAMINQPAIRLISLIGPGGMGKTRLALAAAAALSRQIPRPFADGIVLWI